MSELSTWLVIIAFYVAYSAMGVYAIRFGCRVCARFVPSFKESAIAIGWTYLASVPVLIVNGVRGLENNWAAQLSLSIIGLGISAFVLGAKLKHPEDGSIGFKKGGLVSLVWIGFLIVVITVGTAVFFGVFMLYGSMFSTPKQQGFQPAPQVQETTLSPSKKQQDLFRVAQEIIAAFPQLDVDSPNKNQAAIDYVVRARDGYIAQGHAFDIALRMAANDYAEALRLQAQQAYVQPAAKAPAQAKPKPTWHEQREQRPKCNLQPVMTDAEIDDCRKAARGY